MRKIDLVPPKDGGEGAFDPDRMARAEVDGAVLSHLLSENLGHFSALLRDGHGFGVIVRDGRATIMGLTDSPQA